MNNGGGSENNSGLEFVPMLRKRGDFRAAPKQQLRVIAGNTGIARGEAAGIVETPGEKRRSGKLASWRPPARRGEEAKRVRTSMAARKMETWPI